MPYFNQRFEDLFAQRYTAFLLPLCFSAMGMAAGNVVGLLWARQRLGPRVLAAGCLVLVLTLAAYPLRNLASYYTVETHAGRDNALTLGMAEALKDSLPPGTPLYVSIDVKGVPGDGGFRYLRALYYYLRLAEVEHWILDFPDLETRLKAERDREVWLILPPGDHEVLAADYALEPIEGFPPVINDGLLLRYIPPGQGP
jgi:hypothetical protein